MQDGQLTDLFHYPIKGLRAQSLRAVVLRPGQGFPADRIAGFARHDSGFDPDHPAPLAKHHFLMLMRDERLALLDTHFDPQSRVLAASQAGRTVLREDMTTAEGRTAAEGFFARMFDLPPEHSPRFVHADPHRFTDVSVVSPALMNAVSLMNLDSIGDLATRIGAPVDPARFRANIYFSGWPPFSELELVGRDIRIGAARARITLRTRRCAATEVNPVTAARDIPVPRHLKMTYGHIDLGVYAEILEGGEIRPGDAITRID